jgi:hypothetical protein
MWRRKWMSGLRRSCEWSSSFWRNRGLWSVSVNAEIGVAILI